MPQTRNISVTIFEVDGNPLVGARVEIRLVGLGIGADGAIAPERSENVTGEDGRCVFQLWQNNQALSDTEYEIRSYHPEDGSKIHNGETFRVYDSDADVKDLINLAPVQIDPNQELLEQVVAARAGAEAAWANASAILAEVQAIRDSLGQGGTAPIVQNQTINVVDAYARIIYLGPASNADGAITYSTTSPMMGIISGNMGIFYSSQGAGQFTIPITATNAAGQTGTGTITVISRLLNAVTEYSLPNVQVQAA